MSIFLLFPLKKITLNLYIFPNLTTKLSVSSIVLKQVLRSQTQVKCIQSVRVTLGNIFKVCDAWTPML